VESSDSAGATARKIVFTAQVDVLVEDIAQTQQRLNELLASIQQAGGYVAHQELSGMTGSRRHGTWTLRVPQTRFDQVMSDLEQLGELQRSSRDAQDVTEAFTDLEARLKNKQSSEQRLLSHLEKTGELKDTLEVERELSRVRGEVEQLQGQLNLLKHKTDLATIILTIRERAGFTPVTAPTFATQASRTFAESWQAFGGFLRMLALFVVAVVPWLILAAPILGAVWLWRRKQPASNPE
jgi:vacuolar-type H+-ATPase subunit I/STV1